MGMPFIKVVNAINLPINRKLNRSDLLFDKVIYRLGAVQLPIVFRD